MPGFTWSTSETPTKNPSPSNCCVVPSTTTVAPSAAAPVTYEATLSRCSRVMSGPISLAASVPSPMTSAPMRDAHRLDEPVGHVADGDEHRHGHAALAGRAVGGRDRRIRGAVEVGVGHDDHVVLRAAEGLHALAVRRGALVDRLGDGRRADERDGAHLGGVEDRVDRDLVAVHDVEHAVGQAGLLEQLREEDRGARVLLGGLQHDGVAARRSPMATIHSGTMTGKLNGRDRADHADAAASSSARRRRARPARSARPSAGARARRRTRRSRCRARSRPRHPRAPCRARS